MNINFIVKRKQTNYYDVEMSLANEIMKHFDNEIVVTFSNQYLDDSLNFSMFFGRGGDVFMSHGIADKNYLFKKDKDGNFEINKYKFVFVPGPWLKDKILSKKGIYLTSEQIVCVGWPRLDMLKNIYTDKTVSIKKNVLWAPTHDAKKHGEKKESTSSYPVLENVLLTLNKNLFNVKNSLHPRNRKNKETTSDLLVNSDVIISDFGTMVYEAWLLGKPVVFPSWLISEGIQKYRKGSAEAYIFENKIGYHPSNEEEFLRLLEMDLVVEDDVLNFLEYYIPLDYRSCSGKLIANFLVDHYMHDNAHEGTAKYLKESSEDIVIDSYSKKIYFLMRYSVVSKEVQGGWRVGKENDFDTYTSNVFDSDRLDFREALFKNITLASLISQKKDVDFELVMIISTEMPESHLKSLKSLIEEYPWVKFLSVTPDESLLNSVDAYLKYDLNKKEFPVIYSTTWLDDDDALGLNFVTKLREYLNPKYEGFAISFPRGYQGFIALDNEGPKKLFTANLPKLALGLSYISIYNGEKIITKFSSVFHCRNMRHANLDLSVPVILDGSEYIYFRTHHDFSDLNATSEDKRIKYIKKSGGKQVPLSDLNKRILIDWQGLWEQLNLKNNKIYEMKRELPVVFNFSKLIKINNFKCDWLSGAVLTTHETFLCFSFKNKVFQHMKLDDCIENNDVEIVFLKTNSLAVWYDDSFKYLFLGASGLVEVFDSPDHCSCELRNVGDGFSISPYRVNFYLCSSKNSSSTKLVNHRKKWEIYYLN